MRLHVLEVTGVGPFRATQRVDFDQISRSGLFLIEGPTGSGKTTLLDSIVFALYGVVSGKASDVNRMRSHLCEPSEPSEVMLEFSIAGVRHRIRRSPAYERPRLRGEGTTLERARQTLEILDGSVPPMREAREIGGYLLQRIGLSADHFRQLVVLPQGEFDALLRASPRQRYDVLGGLIDDGFLARVQEELRERSDAAEVERQAARDRVDTTLGILMARVAEVDPTVTEVLGEVVDDGIDGADADGARDEADASAEECVARVEAAAASAAGEAATLAGPAERAQALHASAEQAATAMAEAAEAHERLSAARGRAHPDDRALDLEAITARHAELVTQRTRLEPWAAWESAAPEREREDQRLLAAVSLAENQLATVRARVAALPERRAALAAHARDVTQRAATAQPLRDTLARLEADARLLDEVAEAADLVTRASAEAERRRMADVEARESLLQAREAHVDLMARQLEQRAAHLAARLADAEPCPVCGSRQHPSPAQAPSDELVDDDATAASEARVRVAEEAAAAAAAALSNARQALAGAEARHDALRARTEGLSPASIVDAIDATRGALQAAEQAEAEFDDVARQQALLDNEEAEAGVLVDAAIATQSDAAAALRSYRDGVAREQARHDADVTDGSAASSVETLQQRIAALLELQSALSRVGALPPHARALDGRDPAETLAALESALAEARAQRDAAQASWDASRDRAARLADAVNALHDHLGALDLARRSLEEVIAATETAVSLGNLASARCPANLRRLTLQSYAVQRRFRAVLEAGSGHLERMSNGQYSFALDEEAGRGQSGLGIEVLDAWTGRSRDPASLSGGETFYAALALALGLADIVREETGGVDLETLFVDEGFGSLDTVTLQSVLDQLDALRSRGRSVGVISHVTEMRDWVHDRIQVVPGPPGEGSTLHHADTPN